MAHTGGRWPLFFTVVALGVTVSGCATVFSGGHKDVSIAIRPLGSRVCVDGREVGETPMVASLSRKRSHMIVVEREGYRPAAIPVTRTVNPWVIGNFVPLLILPGPLGLLIDVISGGLHELQHGPTEFQLQPDTATAPGRSRERCTV